MTNITRRTMLTAAAAGAIVAIPAAAPATTGSPTPPTRRQLDRYLAFLTAEARALARELGYVAPDGSTYCPVRPGARLEGSPALRALPVLAAVGLLSTPPRRLLGRAGA